MPCKPRTKLINRAEFYEITGRLQHFACFDCRKTFKQPFSRDSVYLCPQCHRPMTNMGTDFKAPPQKDVQQWRKVEALAQAGVKFFPSYRDGLPGERPATLAEVPSFLRKVFPPSAGERMLEGTPQHSPAPREGRLKVDGTFPYQTYSLLGQPVEQGAALELLQDREWRSVAFIATGNGGVPIRQPYILPRVATMTYGGSPPIFLHAKHRLRWPQ